MWYVIGAVIVGAALILLMNGVFPNLFASVGETFNNKVEDVADVVKKTTPDTMTDGAGPVAPDPEGKLDFSYLTLEEYVLQELVSDMPRYATTTVTTPDHKYYSTEWPVAITMYGDKGYYTLCIMTMR